MEATITQKEGEIEKLSVRLMVMEKQLESLLQVQQPPQPSQSQPEHEAELQTLVLETSELRAKLVEAEDDKQEAVRQQIYQRMVDEVCASMWVRIFTSKSSSKTAMQYWKRSSLAISKQLHLHNLHWWSVIISQSLQGLESMHQLMVVMQVLCLNPLGPIAPNVVSASSYYVTSSNVLGR